MEQVSCTTLIRRSSSKIVYNDEYDEERDITVYLRRVKFVLPNYLNTIGVMKKYSSPEF